MDAATPFRRWLLAAGIAAAGCQSTPDPWKNEGPPPPIARPQAPSDPLAPIPPGPPPVSQPSTVPPVTPVVGQPVTPAAPTPGQPVPGQPVPAGYSPGGAGLLKGVGAAVGGSPRVKIVAHVGAGNIVTDEEVWEAVRQRMGEYLTPVDGPQGKEVVRDEAREKAIYREELQRIIERELILDDMYARLKKAGKAHVVDEIKDFASKGADRQLREFRKMFKARTDDEFREILVSQGLTLPVIKRQIERQMMADEYVRSLLKEKGKGAGIVEVKEYYDKHPNEFRTEDRVKWLDIFISFNKFATPRQAYDFALAVRNQAAAGADFATLSRQHDHGLSGPRGGEGIGTRRGEIQPADVEPTVWALRPGEVSNLIETPAGYHVVKVVERQAAGVRPFDEKVQDEVRKKLMKQMQDREYRRLVEELWRKGAVKVIEVPQ